VAAVSCLTGLGRQPLSWDEAVTANAASRSIPELWLLVRHTDAPLASYYLGMHGWQRLLSAAGPEAGAGWLRLPSALAAVVAVALTARLAAELFSLAVGLLAGYWCPYTRCLSSMPTMPGRTPWSPHVSWAVPWRWPSVPGTGWSGRPATVTWR